MQQLQVVERGLQLAREAGAKPAALARSGGSAAKSMVSPWSAKASPKARSMDRLPKCKKCKVSKEAIIESEAEAEVVEVTAEPGERPCGRAWTGPAEVLPRASEGPKVARALWEIAADL